VTFTGAVFASLELSIRWPELRLKKVVKKKLKSVVLTLFTSVPFLHHVFGTES
jgi:hypothetical protein